MILQKLINKSYYCSIGYIGSYEDLNRLEVYINHNLPILIEFKNLIIVTNYSGDFQKENEDLKNENLTSEQTVMVINEANVLVENKSLLSNLMIYYPILFLVIYVLVSLLIGLYSYLDKLDRAS